MNIAHIISLDCQLRYSEYDHHMLVNKLNLAAVIFSLALLLVPLAFWLERAYPDNWTQPLLYPQHLQKIYVQCYGANTVLTYSTSNNYSLIELPRESRACDRFTNNRIVPLL